MKALRGWWRGGFAALAGIALVLGGLATGGARASSVVPAEGGVRWVAGISPFLGREDRNEVYRQLVAFVLEAMPLDSSLVVLDAYHLRTVARIEVPAARAFASAKTRASQFRGELQGIRRFLATETPLPEVKGLDFGGALRVPAFLDFVAENLVEAGKPTGVVLLGSPLHQDEKEPGFSMAQGYFPSDGHLLVTRDRSVYGLADRGKRLDGVTVHWGYFGEPWASELHRGRITRFWQMFVEGQGARSGAFAGDLPTVFTAAKRLPPAERSGAEGERPCPAAGKPEMLRVTRDVGTSDWITRDTVAEPARQPPSVTKGPLRIGIRWQGNLDLDLYARPRPEGTRLYFERPRSPEGYYFKDHRSSPDREYEFIEFTEPVDVREVDVAVNLYAGRSEGGVEGEVRVEFEGRIYVDRFRIEAGRGNQGREGPAQAAAWCPIDVPRILRLR